MGVSEPERDMDVKTIPTIELIQFATGTTHLVGKMFLHTIKSRQ